MNQFTLNWGVVSAMSYFTPLNCHPPCLPADVRIIEIRVFTLSFLLQHSETKQAQIHLAFSSLMFENSLGTNPSMSLLSHRKHQLLTDESLFLNVEHPFTYHQECDVFHDFKRSADQDITSFDSGKVNKTQIFCVE